MWSKTPSLKTGQFWRISTNDAPLWACARLKTWACPSTSIVARDERRASAEREGGSDERVFDRALGVEGLDLADLRGRRVLALREAVDPVVEEQDLEVDVAAQRVDQVVAADGEAIAVTRDDPHVSSGFASLRPVAIAGARPWIVWKP
jgi:hypothetical protein